jgi:hypothetical protein
VLWPLPDNTQYIHKRHSCPRGIRTRNPIKRAAAKLSIRPRVHLDRKNCFPSLHFFQALSQNFLKAIISFFVSVCPTFGQSVRMDKLGSHSKDFHENCYLKIFPKSVENIKISLKSGKNNV